MVKDQLFKVKLSNSKDSILVRTRYTFDLQEARRWKKEAPYGEIINAQNKKIQ
jgi:hypothetical protein|tara:strand:- start:604 stop:762 length:159 start_codon:yes stop_codon:yes gene_type:complete